MNKIKSFLMAMVMATTALFANHSMAADDPKFFIEDSINQLIEKFTANRAALEADHSKLYSMAEEFTRDNWDFKKMARLVLGKNWKKATPEQQTRFTAAFKDLLIHTYGSAIFKYTGKESINFGETKYKGKKQNRAIVQASGDLGNGSPPVAITFSTFMDKDSGSWKVYNIGVEGVSLVTTYRTTYANTIRTQGMASLIKSIEQKNGEIRQGNSGA